MITKALVGDTVYRGDTVDLSRDFYVRMGNFDHTHYKGNVGVIVRGYTESGDWLGLNGGTLRDLVHSDYNYYFDKNNNYTGEGVSSYGKVSAGCFVNTVDKVQALNDQLMIKWRIPYSYDIKFKGTGKRYGSYGGVN